MPSATLASETQSKEEAEALLLQAALRSDFLERFTDADIASLCEHLSFVGFEAEEQVMARGEVATWTAIVLSGELAAMVNGQVVGTMQAGHT